MFFSFQILLFSWGQTSRIAQLRSERRRSTHCLPLPELVSLRMVHLPFGLNFTQPFFYWHLFQKSWTVLRINLINVFFWNGTAFWNIVDIKFCFVKSDLHHDRSRLRPHLLHLRMRPRKRNSWSSINDVTKNFSTYPSSVKLMWTVLAPSKSDVINEQPQMRKSIDICAFVQSWIQDNVRFK